MSIESHLEEFVCIVEEGSISGAARKLGIPRASLGRHLANLEASYQTRLLHRETQKQTLTAAGKELYLRARKIVADLAETRSAVSTLDGVPRGLLRVGLPAESLIDVTIARTYLAAYPEVKLEFIGIQKHEDLISRGIDVALRSGKIEDEGLIGRKILSFKTLVYASPDLLERLGTPTLETLPGYPCILGFDANARPIVRWPLWSGASVSVQGPLRTNRMSSRHEAAIHGMGLAMLSERIARKDVTQGKLVPVLTDIVGTTTPLTLVWPSAEFMEPKVRAFVDLMVDLIGKVAAKGDQDWEDLKAREARRP